MIPETSPGLNTPGKTELRVSSQIQRIVQGDSVVYKKHYVTNDWDDDFGIIKQRAKRELELLKQISESPHFGGRHGVVRVADFDSEVAMISTFEIPGISVGQYILKGQDASTNLAPWYLAGSWLNRLHNVPLPANVPETRSKRDPLDLVDYCHLRLKTLSEYGYRWPSHRLQDKLLGKIEDLQRDCTPLSTESVWVHADYAPGNLIWDGRVLTPIDFSMARVGNQLDDATYLIHRAEMHRVYRPWLRLPVDSIRRAVLRGLGKPNADRSPLYQTLMIKHRICRLHTYVRRPGHSLKQKLHDHYVRTVLKRQLRLDARSE